jgi:hypothetical protein
VRDGCAPLVSYLSNDVTSKRVSGRREEDRRCYERCVLTTTSLSRKDTSWHCRKLLVEDPDRRCRAAHTHLQYHCGEARRSSVLLGWMEGVCVAVRADFLKYLLNLSRRSKRARESRAFTEAWVRPNASAVLLVENPSTSRNTKTTRRAGRSSCKLLVNMSRSCETP